jgi:hypothetical protein
VRQQPGSSGASKLKRDHHMLLGLREALAPLCARPDVERVVPARIRPGSRPPANGRLFLKIQGSTSTGLRLLAHGKAEHGGGAVQEVFVCTHHPDDVAAFVTAAQGGGCGR